MKMYYDRPPQQDYIVVRPNNEGDEVEFYAVTYKLLGTAVRAGRQRIYCEGNHYSNLNSALIGLLNKAGMPELANTVSAWVKKPAAKVLLPGIELVTRGVWNKFCELRKIASTADNVGRKWYLSANEMKVLGLDQAAPDQPEPSNAPMRLSKGVNSRSKSR